MAIRQYVGARYVPRFTGLYDATQVYEALDVVDNGLGTSYIAKKTTPAGTPLTDTDYWFVYGASSGAIINLQNQIDALRLDVSDNAGDIITLDEKFTNLKYKHILFIGDSYERSVEFCDYISTSLGHGTPSFISTNVRKSPDGFIWIASRGGSGFTNDGGGKSSGNGFLNMLTEAFGDMSAEEAANIDIICIAGGVNDSFYNLGDADLPLLATNMTAFNDYAKANFTRAQIDIFFLGRVRQLDTHVGLNPKDIRYNIYRYIDLAGRFGWGFIANSQYVSYQRDNFIGVDNLHPRSEEQGVIARYIMEGLICGSVDVTWIDNNIYEMKPTSPTTGNTIQMSCNLVNGKRRVKTYSGMAWVLDNVPINFNSAWTIGTQDAFFATSAIDVPLYGAQIWDGAWKMFNGILRFYGYDVILVNRGAEGTGNASITFSTLNAPTIDFTFDTLIS